MTKQPDFMPALDLDALTAEQVVARLLDFAAEKSASDLLFACDADAVTVSMRHLGIQRPVATISSELGRHCMSHIRASASMDFAEHRKPQDGRWIHRAATDELVDLRINILPTLHGEDINLRLLNRRRNFVLLEKLGMITQIERQFREAIESPSGLVLVTGPTGAGKTTTLYAALQHLSNGLRKINTVEDPIEFDLPGTRQSQINPRIGLDFAELLRSVLRQAPDVIMVGEIRDAVTAETAVRAANSGHLVLATLHAPGAAAAIHSLETYGILPHYLGPSLTCVISQRLVRTLCGDCRKAASDSPWPQMFEEVGHLRDPNAPRQLFANGGCPRCDQTGYLSRTGVFEYLGVNDKLRHLIYNKASAGEIYRQALDDDMIPFRTAALLKIAEGLTTAAEVQRVFPAEFLEV